MKATLIFSIAILMLVGVSTAQAQPFKARHERERIAAGVRNGQLTRAEAYRLSREQHSIHHDRMRYKRNDGHIGPRERKHLMYERKKASRQIYHYKHNGRVRHK